MALLRVETGAKFSVPVDYARPLAESVAAGGYDLVDPKITDKYFLPDRRSRKRTVSMRLLSFDGLVERLELEEEMRRHAKLRLAVLPELLAVGEHRPELQRDAPIAALSSCCKVGQSPGVLQVPYLAGNAKERRLCLGARNFGWSDAFRFLVVQW